MIVLRRFQLLGTLCVLAALILGVWVEVAQQTASAQDGEGRGRGGFGRRSFSRRGMEMPIAPVAQPEAPKTEEKKEEKKDEKPAEEKKAAVETVKRPDRPKREANREELTLKPDKDGKIRFNFRGQQWTDVLEWYAEIANVSLDWQEVPGKTVDLVTQQSYTVDEARDVLNRLLLDRGFTLVRNGEVLSVINLTTMNPGVLPRVEPEELKDRDAHEFVKTSMQLDTLLAETAAEEFKGMMSTYGKLTPLKTTNRLEAVDAVANLRELYRVVSQEQSSKGQERLVMPFELKYTRALDIKEKLEALLGIEKKQSNPGPMTPEMMQQMQQQAAQRAAQRGAGAAPDDKKTQVFIVANERDNSILVSGPADKIAVVRQAVTLLDQPSGKSGYADTLQSMKVYRLAAIDPESLMKMLQTKGNLDPTTQLEVDKTNNALIVTGSMIDQGKIRMMVDTLDGSGRRFKVLRLRRLPADYVAGTITVMVNGDEEEQSSSRRRRSYYSYGGYGGYGSQQPQKNDKFRASADVEHNKLLLWANEVELKLVDDFLVELGEIPPKDGNPNTTRVLELPAGDQTDELLKKLKEAWPNLAPNELKIEIVPEKKDERKDAKPDRDLRTEQKEKEKAAPKEKEKDTVALLVPGTRHRLEPFLKLAQLETADEAKSGEQEPAAETQQDAKEDAAPSKEEVTEEPKSAEPKAEPKEEAVQKPEEKGQPDEQGQPNEAERRFREEVRKQLEGSQRKTPPSITITRSPNGGLVIQSEDPRALDMLEELIGELTPTQPDFVEFRLKHANAYWIGMKLEEFFKVDEKKGNSDFDSWWWGYQPEQKEESPNSLSKRKPLKFIDEEDTNTIIVQGGDASQLKTVKQLIEIWDRPEPKDTQSARKWQSFPVSYSKAKAVAETIKEVYRDLLSENDKSLQDGNSKDKDKKPPADRIYTYIDTGGADEKRNPVRFKGLLSVGIDELSNTLIVSAPEWLMSDVGRMIKHLDEAAMPTSKVQVMQVDRRINSAVLQKKLAEVFGKRGTPGGGDKQNGQQGPNNGQGDNNNNGQNNGQRGGRRGGGGD